MASNPTRPFPPAPSLSFNDYKLTPDGVSAMTTHLRTLPLLQTIPEARVRAAAIALITFGGSSDGKDQVRRGDTSFQSASSVVPATSMLSDWHDGLGNEYMRMIMDMLACHDRASGGVSFLISTPGTHRAGTLPTITEVKMDVFLPIVLLREQPQARTTFTRIVQSFAEEIGLPVMQRRIKAKSFKPPKVVTANVAPRVDTQPLVPSSNPPWLTLYGRDVGVFERLIAERTVVFPALSEVPSIIPGPLPSQVPEALTPPAQSSSVSNSKKGKQVERKPWTVDDVRHYAEQLEVCGEHDEAGRQAIMQQVWTRLPELFGVVGDLARRVDDLETIEQTQLFEIASLQQMLQDPSDRRDVELTRLVAKLAVPFVPEQNQRSSHTVDKEDTSMSHPARSDSSKPGGLSSIANSSPLPSAYKAQYGQRSVMSMQPVPIAPTPSHNSTFNATMGHTPLPGRPSVRVKSLTLGGGKIFGPHTDDVLAHHRLPRRVHTILRNVEKNYPAESWTQNVRLNLAKCSDDVVRELVEAMNADRKLTASMRS